MVITDRSFYVSTWRSPTPGIEFPYYGTQSEVIKTITLDSRLDALATLHPEEFQGEGLELRPQGRPRMKGTTYDAKKQKEKTSTGKGYGRWTMGLE